MIETASAVEAVRLVLSGACFFICYLNWRNAIRNRRALHASGRNGLLSLVADNDTAAHGLLLVTLAAILGVDVTALFLPPAFRIESPLTLTQSILVFSTRVLLVAMSVLLNYNHRRAMNLPDTGERRRKDDW